MEKSNKISLEERKWTTEMIKGEERTILKSERRRSNQFGGLLADLGAEERPGQTQYNKFLEKNPLPQEELTGLPTEQQARNYIVTRLADCLRSGERWAVLLSDLDQLKVANNIGRDFGDQYIRWGAVQIKNLIRASGISPQAEIVLIRATGAADEYVVCFFGIDDEDVKKIQGIMDGLRQELPTGINDFTFSSSAAIVFDDDERIAKEKIKTRLMFKNQKDGIAPQNPDYADLEPVYDFFSYIKEQADAVCHLQKIKKDLDRLPISQLAHERVETIVRMIVEKFGGTRISPLLLRKIIELTSVTAVSEIIPQLESEGLGALNFSDNRSLKEIYSRLFEKEIGNYTPLSDE